MQNLNLKYYPTEILQNHSLLGDIRRAFLTGFRVLLFTASLFAMHESFAAPFCVVTGSGKNCTYIDAKFCQQTAATLGGMCVVNDQDKKPQYGDAAFCVVTSSATNCTYNDANFCRQTAKNLRGACVPNPNR